MRYACCLYSQKHVASPEVAHEGYVERKISPSPPQSLSFEPSLPLHLNIFFAICLRGVHVKMR